MLDTETKRRIDTARDILVGKVPDPKSQVEQITIALIYKFMDDMDAEAEELGGARKFFNGEFAKYGWAKLMSPAMGGHEVINLYGEAITKMTENEGIPPLFRDIFKNAYLPYRDPETLKSFLKIIDDFEYDHSERLGDAFEYLLSVLGAQGDAGQFRTPRHIIDFMVKAIDPKKDESILDPACGTAGFLISAYKHILKANSEDNRAGAALTPDERKTLTGNIKGYDISPDMVRLSLVNLYLHGFTDPHIAEYDTLTSEDNWNDYADIVLANPPFMSPKGGIKPHKRFSIQAKRSEVLFVDYIAEHLTPNGRAAVIVPEGIIFQSQNAYKQLREMLVKNYLYAVVSLPSGVFQPYSGVKTSILLMDKAVVKKCDSLLFVKVEADGFDLGAQRRKIDKNDLPETIAALQDFHQCCLIGEEFNANLYSNVLKVEKEKISENGEWSLSRERYLEEENLISTNYELVELGEVCELESGSRQKGGAVKEGVPSIGGGEITVKGEIKVEKMKYISPEYFSTLKKGVLKENDVLVVKDGATTGKTGFYSGEFNHAAVNEHVFIFRSKENMKPIFLYHLIRSNRFQNKLRKYIKGIIGGIGLEIKQITIPLPPLNIQQQIAAKIEGYQKIIDGARSVVDNYKPQIESDPDWEMVTIRYLVNKNIIEKPLDGNHGEIHPKASDYVLSGIPFIMANDLVDGKVIIENTKKITKEQANSLRKGFAKNDDVLLTHKGTIGRTAILLSDYDFVVLTPQVTYYRIKNENELLNAFLKCCFDSASFQEKIKQIAGIGATRAYIGITNQLDLEIPLPPIETQKEIVAQVEKEQSLVNANKELITLFEQKIKDKIASVWGE